MLHETPCRSRLSQETWWSMFRISFLILVGSLWSQGAVFANVALPLIPLDQVGVVRPHTPIRVRIFPHERGLLPHGIDDDRSFIGFESSGDCQKYRALATASKPMQETHEVIRKETFVAALLTSPIFITCTDPFRVSRPNGKSNRYTGSLYIRKLGDDSLEVVQMIGLEDYLRSVVPSEVYSHWPLEALKTQAVAARTYALYHLLLARRSGMSFWDVDDTIAYQVYSGVDAHTPLTDQAVFATRGQVLRYQNQVIQAFYHADSGGTTAFAKNVFGVDIPYLTSKKEPFSKDGSMLQWTLRVDLQKLTRLLHFQGYLPKINTVTDLVVPINGRSESGRVIKLAMTRDDGAILLLPIGDFKKLFSNTALKSTLFDIEPLELTGSTTASVTQPPSRIFEIRGLGFGHGVGMSQSGAALLAGNDNNWQYHQILSYYYQGTSLCTIATPSLGLKSCYHDSNL